MIKTLETTGRTEEAAVQSALEQLGLDRDSVSVEILDRAKKGFLGLGSTPAKVRVTYEVPDPVEPPKPAAPVKKCSSKSRRSRRPANCGLISSPIIRPRPRYSATAASPSKALRK